MIFRVAFVAALLISLLTACTDRYRNPCEAAAYTTTTLYRTKNKALGWVNPPVTTIYGSYNGRHVIHKCA